MTFTKEAREILEKEARGLLTFKGYNLVFDRFAADKVIEALTALHKKEMLEVIAEDEKIPYLGSGHLDHALRISKVRARNSLRAEQRKKVQDNE